MQPFSRNQRLDLLTSLMYNKSLPLRLPPLIVFVRQLTCQGRRLGLWLVERWLAPGDHRLGLPAGLPTRFWRSRLWARWALVLLRGVHDASLWSLALALGCAVASRGWQSRWVHKAAEVWLLGWWVLGECWRFLAPVVRPAVLVAPGIVPRRGWGVWPGSLMLDVVWGRGGHWRWQGTVFALSKFKIGAWYPAIR